MKQVTIRLNETGEKELERVKKMLGMRSAQSTLEHVLIAYRHSQEAVYEAEKKLLEAQAVIEYLEGQLKRERD